MKKYIIIICLATMSFCSKAQQQLLHDSATTVFIRMNEAFDSSFNLSFDLQVDYQASVESIQTVLTEIPFQDSLGNPMPIGSESVAGHYILNMNKMYYEMGNSIFAQTDSFMYSIYKEEEMMVMTKGSMSGINQQFPFKEILDSLLHPADYTISIDTVATDSTQDLGYNRIITYTPTTTALLKQLVLYYDHATYHPYLLKYTYLDTGVAPITEIPEIDTTLASMNAVTLSVNRTISMQFSNYRTAYNTKVFNEEEYTIYNRQRKIYETADRFSNYQFHTSGFDNADPNEEMYAEKPYVEQAEN